MTRLLSISSLAAVLLACGGRVMGQGSGLESAWGQLRANNTRMAPLQPAWMGPLIQPDSRLTQSLRLSLSNSYTPARTRTLNWGNYHTLGLIAGDRVQINLMAPPYLQNHASGMPDGFGDTMAEAKVRIASGNAGHGNFALTAMLTRSLPTGSHQNGAPTGVWYPTLAAGKMWGRFDAQTMLGGSLPAGKIWAQGREIDWNTTAQARVGTRLWVDLEDNAVFKLGGPLDGTTENFLTPAAFLVLQRKAWKPTHPVFVPGLGMQIATSRAPLYNHSLIAELRVLF